MEEQFVTYEIALKLKELGFDEECLGYYSNGMQDVYFKFFNNDEDSKFLEQNYKDFNAPLWQQVFDWFREKHKINILINPSYACYNIKITKYDDYEDDNIVLDIDSLDFKDFSNYHEAREQAILKALELINN